LISKNSGPGFSVPAASGAIISRGNNTFWGNGSDSGSLFQLPGK
jgi:hypothetical protein